VCLPACYDDGGFSGATMDRPALQRLLADITAGRVDTVVVYDIDRLTKHSRLPLAWHEQPIVLGFALSRSQLKAPPRSLTPKATAAPPISRTASSSHCGTGI
jgi:Resolvase, N terminal domain